MGTFDDRMRELSEEIGDGDLTGKVEVDQVYAKYQHEGLDLNHPRGGGPKYLQRPMIDRADDHMRSLAKDALEPDGLVQGMRRVVDQVVDGVRTEAPVEFDDLRRSGHATVEDDGHTVYDKPAEVQRLTEEELKAKNRFRNLGYAHSVRVGRDGLPG